MPVSAAGHSSGGHSAAHTSSHTTAHATSEAHTTAAPETAMRVATTGHVTSSQTVQSTTDVNGEPHIPHLGDMIFVLLVIAVIIGLCVVIAESFKGSNE